MKNSGPAASVSPKDPDPLGTEAPEEPPSISSGMTQDLLFAAQPIRKFPLTGRIPITLRSRQFLRDFYPDATEVDWASWSWQIRNSICSLDQIQRIIRLTPDECAAILRRTSGLPFRITPYYASLMSPADPSQSIRRSVIPVTDEYTRCPGEERDPLSEEHQSPVPGLVHRYPDRVLFLTTGFCSTYCRYCTRSRMVGNNGRFRTSITQWQQAIAYIEEHPEVRDVLLSGGDPLTLPDSHLDYLLSSIRRIPHVEMIRIGTKVPVVLPQRITPKLMRILKKYQPLWMSIHFTHPDELTPETQAACNQLADSGIPLGSQTVLLKGINDNVDTLKSLFHGLLKVRVRPYYLYQCDPILGSAHLRTTIEKGIEMIEGLRGHTSGYAVPHYVVDAPGGGGKIPLLPDYFQGRANGQVILRNYEHRSFSYPEYCEEMTSRA
ncbi:MAG TPA: KamA family radical SAM protein [Deltaproteobacteria bacterium]|jgi:lysine 2,3-aminomutase|nr:KamA family radical SAM protein [Deltaproteobacteria bacterium]HQJ08119.1 KamA family radical SAM protein [Deltaproteobacteria bacterium]